MATIGDLVVRLSANTKAFDSGIAKSQVALQHMTNAATKTVNAVSDLNSIRVNASLTADLAKASASMFEMKTVTTDLDQSLGYLEDTLDLTAFSAGALSGSLKLVTGTSGIVSTSALAMSKSLTSTVIVVVALRQTIRTLSFAFRLAADGVETLLIPLRMAATAFQMLGSVALRVVNLMLTPLRMLISVIRIMTPIAWAMIRPFLGFAGTLVRVYIAIKAFQIQLKMLRWVFSVLPPRVKAVVVGLMALGAASRVASAALGSLGVVGRMAGRAISLLTLPIRALISPVKTARDSVAVLNSTLQKTAAVATQAAVAVQSRLGDGLKSMAGSFAGSLKTLASFAANALPFAAIGAVKLAADAETLAMKLRVLTGSADAAAGVMRKLDAFAADTPFMKMEVGQATQQLIAFGSQTETVFDELKMIGDISAATGTPLTEMAELYGKARIQGRLFGEDINQLTGRGIPIVQALKKEFGDVDIKRLVAEGKIGFPELQRALASMVGPAGQFGGMMSDLSTTTAGKFSTFVDKFLLLGTAIGEVLLPHANALLDWASNMVGAADGIGNAFSGAIDTATRWFVSTRNALEDVGAVAGVVVGNMSNIWSAMFEEVPKFAGAAFDWITTNAQTVLDNIGTMVENLYKKINSVGMQLGEEIAFQLGLSDEVLNIAEAAQKPMKAFTPVPVPEVGKITKGVLEAINEALAINAQQRAGIAAAAAAKQQTDIARNTGLNTGFIDQSKTSNMQDGKKETQLAGAAKAGSQEAYSILAQSFIKSKDPQVKATQEQTKALLKPLGQMAAAAVGGLGGFGGFMLVEQI